MRFRCWPKSEKKSALDANGKPIRFREETLALHYNRITKGPYVWYAWYPVFDSEKDDCEFMWLEKVWREDEWIRQYSRDGYWDDKYKTFTFPIEKFSNYEQTLGE